MEKRMNIWGIHFFFFFKILFIYSWETQNEREKQREKQAPCKEPDVGLDPETPGSRPGPKADDQSLIPEASLKAFFKKNFSKRF